MAHVIFHGGPHGGEIFDAPSDEDGTEFEHDGGLYRVNAELQAVYVGKTDAAKQAEADALRDARRAEIAAKLG